MRDWDQLANGSHSTGGEFNGGHSNGDDWRRQAKCLGSNPAVFFPLGATGEPLVQSEAAKRVCQSCPVRSPCLQFALETNQETGVWGGTTEEERRTLRRNWLRTPRGT